MNTKTIFKMLAAVMLMPAMLLTTACSSDDDAVVNNNTENTAGKGYALPVTVTVTRQGDEGTRATYTYDEVTKEGTLEFSEGDKLFVMGTDAAAGEYAGTLEWESEGTFRGIIYTENPYTGTYQNLFDGSTFVQAILLPDGYDEYDYLSIREKIGTEANSAVYDDVVFPDYTKAIALTKVAAVEQLSYETAEEYNNGFALTPHNAILNFTITDLTASTSVDVNLSYSDVEVNKSVTTDASGNATFAVAVANGTNLNACTLTVGGNAITLGSHELAAGQIYNIRRSVYTLLSAVTAADYGKVVCAAGHLHEAKKAVPAGCTAVGILGKVTSTGHGLILGLKDSATTPTWNTINSWTSATYAGTTLKVLDSAARGTNLTSYTQLGNIPVSNWAVAQKSDYVAIFTNLGSTLGNSDGTTYDDNVNAYITGVGGTAISGGRWSATEYDNSYAWYYGSSVTIWNNTPPGATKGRERSVRPVLGF